MPTESILTILSTRCRVRRELSTYVPDDARLVSLVTRSKIYPP